MSAKEKKSVAVETGLAARLASVGPVAMNGYVGPTSSSSSARAAAW